LRQENVRKRRKKTKIGKKDTEERLEKARIIEGKMKDQKAGREL
jgi:hypothetical protein